jgi:hypothetical protein
MARAPPAGIELAVGTQRMLALDGGIRAYGLSRHDVVGICLRCTRAGRTAGLS